MHSLGIIIIRRCDLSNSPTSHYDGARRAGNSYLDEISTVYPPEILSDGNNLWSRPRRTCWA